MKPAKFDYVRPETLDHALEVLSKYGGDAKIIAGGQSLMPMINFRLVKPTVLVDINRLPGLALIEDRGARIHIGALVRHYMIATSPIIAQKTPIIHDAMRHVAHMTVRNRGTFCGSVCHADPATEMPMMVQLLDGQIEIASTRGHRVLSAGDFLVGSLINALEPDELVTGIHIGVSDPLAGWGFEEFSRRHGDFGLAAVALTVRVDQHGAIQNARIGITGVGETAMRLPEIEAVVEGRIPDPGLLAEVAAWLDAHLTPNTDIHASSDYRKNLAGVLMGRALIAAHVRALGKREKPHD